MKPKDAKASTSKAESIRAAGRPQFWSLQWEDKTKVNAVYARRKCWWTGKAVEGWDFRKIKLPVRWSYANYRVMLKWNFKHCLIIRFREYCAYRCASHLHRCCEFSLKDRMQRKLGKEHFQQKIRWCCWWLQNRCKYLFFSLEPHQILSVEKSTQIESIISKNPRETAEYTWIIVDGAKEEECENRFKQFLAKKIVRTNYRSLWLTDKIAIHRPAHLQLEAAICYICGCTSK